MFTNTQRSARSQHSHTRHAGPLPAFTVTALVLLCASLAGCTAVDSPTAGSTEAVSEVPPLPRDGELEAGSYRASNFDVPFQITVPDGWAVNEGFLLVKEPSEVPGVFVMFSNPSYVPVDACGWGGTLTAVTPSVNGFAEALDAAASTTMTTPTDVKVGDIEAVEFDLAVEEGIAIDDCDQGHVCIHSESSSTCSRYYQTTAQRETYRVFDLDGARGVVAHGQWDANADPALVKEARAIFDSIEFIPED